MQVGFSKDGTTKTLPQTRQQKIMLFMLLLSIISFGALYIITGYTQIYIQILLFSKQNGKYMPFLLCIQFAAFVAGVFLVG